MMKRITLVSILLAGMFGTASGQEREAALDRLEKLLKKPTTAVPVRCILEENRFDRIELRKDSELYLVKDIDFDETRTELRYTLSLDQLSLTRYRYEQRACKTLITLRSDGGKRAFSYRRAKYLGNTLTEHESGRRAEVTLSVYKDPGKQIIQALIDLAAAEREK